MRRATTEILLTKDLERNMITMMQTLAVQLFPWNNWILSSRTTVSMEQLDPFEPYRNYKVYTPKGKCKARTELRRFEWHNGCVYKTKHHTSKVFASPLAVVSILKSLSATMFHSSLAFMEYYICLRVECVNSLCLVLRTTFKVRERVYHRGLASQERTISGSSANPSSFSKIVNFPIISPTS